MPNEFLKIGGSPVPGITLRQVLRGHTSTINRIAWSPDGKYLASPSLDKTIRIWDMHTGKCTKTLEEHREGVWSVDWSPDGNMLVSGGSDKNVFVWDTTTWKIAHSLVGHQRYVLCVSWSPNGDVIASGGTHDDNTVRIWEAKTGKLLQTLTEFKTGIYDIVWTPNGDGFITGDNNGDVRFWNRKTGKYFSSAKIGRAYCLKLSPDNQVIAVGAGDPAIYFFDSKNGKTLRKIEGHTGDVESLSFSSDNQLLASESSDNTVRIWSCRNWETVAIVSETFRPGCMSRLAFHPSLPILATLGEESTIIRIWELDETILLGQAKENVNYTTAKLVLVGDSGVGKTGLGWRLAHNEFKEHSSTHGQQFWVIPQLGEKRKDGTECEAVLWDLAGQHVYRPIHSIFLDNVDASLVLFDPSNRQDPLKGAQFWLEQLKGKKQLPPTVLVGARTDRGASVLSQQELDQFCQRNGISGGFIGTSAKTGEGLDKLIETLKQQIPWDQMTTTVTTVTFKRIKDYVLGLKEKLALKKKLDRTDLLVRPAELRQQLQATDPNWEFTDAEMMTAVGHLQNHGYVTILKDSSGEEYILLTVDLLISLASSIVLLADKNPRELGAISESDLLQGRLTFDELKELDKTAQQILIDAAILRFLEHSICFRETLGNNTLLIFPGLIKQKRPLQDDLPATDDISFIVRGRVENLYPMLVVLLGYTPSFTRINQWQNQAQYEMREGEICGFRMIEEREGEIELVLYYGDKMPQDGRETFQQLFEQFLYKHDVQVTRFPPVVCPNKHRQERATVIKRVREGKTFAFCDECGSKINLPKIDEPSFGIRASSWLQREEATARLRNAYEVNLARIKSYRRGWATPRCYVSRVAEQAKWAERFIHDLNDAGVFVVEKASHVQPDDYVIVLDAPVYQKAWQASKEDARLVQARFNKRNLITIVVEGNPCSPHNIDGCQPGDFCDETHYPVSLFDLVLSLYAIPLNHAAFAPLRQSLHQQWEQTAATLPAELKEDEMPLPLKVFISYSHKDEEFKDELVTMLAGLQRQGIIDAWQDRRIEEGDEWYAAIQKAMNDCDLAILLVSQNFFASRFIQDKELPRLLQRRKEQGLRVVPIIVRPCKWQSEPVLKDIQALPKDGKAVITFSKENGDRDQVWTDIATAIEKRSK